ncbi:MAG TPA: glycosyltransferase, partial [Bacteroidales bacterium]|nr:glycosyltransferase [Bacteroidales bacterium]
MNNPAEPDVFIALPVINENRRLPALVESLFNQTHPSFRLIICVNQPDEWWEIPEKRAVCEENALTLAYLAALNDPRIHILDYSSRGNGWKGKKHGVGWARKTVMDAIVREARDTDIIVSLDGDTTFGNDYLQSIVDSFREHPEAVGLAVPYFHKAVEDEAAYRAILRYEIYMRHYSINLWRIGSPYAFTALGSAMACPVRSYKAIGGMSPRMSGEDFYFLQKLRKYGKILCWNREKVFPAARFSDRVYFGTGPAMIKGHAGDWNSYPIYPYHFFDELKESYDLFGSFFIKTDVTPVTT